MRRNKPIVNFTLSPEAKAAIDYIAEVDFRSRSNVLELLLRQEFTRRKLHWPVIDEESGRASIMADVFGDM